ncbi:LysE family translocator [Arthrobacter sp. 260]|uniref:LysE family translocator n=1 Tax=Arthrobacter sp. 260 TaxID=2735314 RepID=UPI0014932095|nr:LysE family translocator [Arthrobacter sp. 260]NOJ60713.1 LysE family translocator [Arthrobacter sp. 260]
MTTANYLALLGVAVILAITPGPDTLLTLKYSLRRRRTGLCAALGSALGVFVWAALVAAGVATFFQDSPAAFHTLRVVGGLYLLYLGYRSVTSHPRARVAAPATRRVTAGAGTATEPSAGEEQLPSPSIPAVSAALLESSVTDTRAAATSGWKAFSAGILCCVTNPKTGLFFLALIPQFTPAGTGALYMIAVVGGTISVVIGGYLAMVAFGAHTASVWLNRPAVTRWIERVSGGIFIALGVMTMTPVLVAMT